MLALTGTSGLVGRYLCDQLISYGIPFKYLDRQINANFPSDTTSFFPFDLLDFGGDSLLSFLDGVDIFVHLAAVLPNPLSDSIDYFSCNSVAPKALFDLCSDVGVCNFVYVSGANIMSAVDGFVTSASTYSTTLRHPIYLTSKMAGELLLMNSSASINLSILRPSSIYGFNVRSGLFRNLYDSLLDSQPVKLSGNGLWSADFIYAGDVAKCILKLIQDFKPGLYTLGSGTLYSIHEISRLFVELLHVDENLIILDPSCNPSPLESLPPVSSTQTFSLLGRDPLSLAEGLSHAMRIYGSI